MLAENYFLIILGLVWIVGAVVQDLRKREVANWWNFSLIGIALAYRALLSVWLLDEWYFLQGLVGLGIFVILGNVFYYGRVFAGGDAKLLMGLGAVLPFSLIFIGNLKIFLYFIVLLLFAGSIYGLLYSFVLVSKHKKEFVKEFSKQFNKNKKLFQIFIFLTILSLVLILIIGDFVLSFLSLIILIFPFLFVYAKSIEEACMVKSIEADKLTIGDWLYEKIKVGRKTIKPNWEGLTENEVKLLKKTGKKILIKEGIPFTPAFLIDYVILIWIIEKGFWGLI